MIAGTLEVWLDELQCFVLNEAGDSFWFESTHGHRWFNPGEPRRRFSSGSTRPRPSRTPCTSISSDRRVRSRSPPAGLWVARLVRGSGDFFVAGRRPEAPLLFSTVLAANIGAGTTVGAPDSPSARALGAWWWDGSAALGSFVLAFWVGPRIWRLAATHGFYTAGDFLEFRYGAAVRAIVAALIWVGTLPSWPASSSPARRSSKCRRRRAARRRGGIGAVVMTIYFVAGGLLSSAWVNLVQLVVLMAGFRSAIPQVWTPGRRRWPAFATGRRVRPPGYLDLMHSSGPGHVGLDAAGGAGAGLHAFARGWCRRPTARRANGP